MNVFLSGNDIVSRVSFYACLLHFTGYSGLQLTKKLINILFLSRWYSQSVGVYSDNINIHFPEWFSVRKSSWGYSSTHLVTTTMQWAKIIPMNHFEVIISNNLNSIKKKYLLLVLSEFTYHLRSRNTIYFKWPWAILKILINNWK